MIYAQPGKTFVAALDQAPSGLVGTLTAQVERSDGTTVSPASTADIIEVETGIYVATRTAPDEAETYFVVWHDPNTDARVSEELVVSWAHPAAAPDPLEVSWRPALAEVGALLHARTKTDLGGELGTFTADTRPTDEQAELLISLATARVATLVGTTGRLCSEDDVNEALTARARGLAALNAAILIELSYFPEQVRNEQSPVRIYRELFTTESESLVSSVEAECGSTLPGGDDPGGSRSPSYDFSATTAPLGREFPW